jgi:guanylate kinase
MEHDEPPMTDTGKERERAYTRRGTLFVVSAPSGAGKTTLCKMLCQRLEGIEHSVSYTTRGPRKGEVNDVDYTFVTRERFMEMVRQGQFLEWAEVHGNLYGTSVKRIEEMKTRGVDVIMDIDVQGAGQLMGKKTEARYIFILPPSLDELTRRLRGRHTDSEDIIGGRLRKAHKEIVEYKRYDYVIINDSLDRALDALTSVVKAGRCRRETINDDWIEENLLQEDVKDGNNITPHRL